jgi:hypothetical protein
VRDLFAGGGDMKEINIYASLGSWLDEKPEATIKGTVKSKTDHTIEIEDEEGYTQIIVLGKLFAVVY